ncbi:uncharacterized protein LOC110829683 isoform X2 [Zootermopsis nevadensis]|uniref:uncharacterized protein LOC110829683 isoform X2 n=1 Tax=Zootermopsis nevadensis TaxID=136037 RepID=UPI000B8E4EC4|nr:uncharacterized protein LOC110829683 isoform X2 [Zootermopsis nevadensis]
MGDRRNKKIRAYRSPKSRDKEDALEILGDIESGRDMGRSKQVANLPGPSRDSNSRDQKRKRPNRERWLLTRKTWRYMADAGRRLIPEGAQNRPEDVPKIEAYFQEVCHREPKFLLWRKSSYPGALGFRSHHRKNRRKVGGSCREKASSADEADTSQTSASSRRFDLQRLKNDFLYGPSSSGSDAHRQRQYFGCENPLLEVPETTVTSPDNEDEETERELMETLSKYLNIREKSVDTLSTGDEAIDIDYQRLVDQLRKYLSTSNILEDRSDSPNTKEDRIKERIRATAQRPISPSSRVSFEADTQERMTLDTFRRYYSKSTCRQKIITDLLTDRKLLENLYFGLRQTRSFKGRTGGIVRGGSGFLPLWTSADQTAFALRRRRDIDEVYKGDGHDYGDSAGTVSWKCLGKSLSKDPRDISPFSPPPLIEIEDKYESVAVNRGTQTKPIPASVLVAIEDELKKARAIAAQEGKEDTNEGGSGRRRSSVDNDDVSPSVSDTIKRYLRMARKKSLDADKVDRFKRVNYDRNLRNIKPKGEITMPGDDDGLNKGCQPDESWITALKELKGEDISSDPEMSPGGDDLSGSRFTSSRSSLEGAGISDDAIILKLPVHMVGKPSPHHSHSSILSTGQNFLSNLLHGLQHHQQQHQGSEEISGMTQSSASTAIPVGGAMQKSKSSSSVVHHGSRVAKKIWRARSKSQSRATSSATSSWTPQGHCTWTNVTGRQVTLTDTSLLTLCELERRMLQKVAVAKLQALNLGVSVRIPSEAVVSVSHKPKRRPYLLKRKALTTGFFDTSRGKDDKDKDGGGGMVFGIPISQCLENDRLSRIQHGGSPGRDEPSELRRKSHHGSRSSFSSLIETTTARGDERGSCESLMSPGDRMAGSVPGLLDSLSCGSTADITSGEREPNIPQIVQSCFRHLENFGLRTLGIFRVSSSKKRIRQLREDFDCGKEICLGEDNCPHDVATLLKEFFRDLPDPLLCRDLYQAFVQTQKIRNRRLQFEALQHLIQLLPVPNRDTLWALLNFLVTVARNAGDYKDETGELSGNKMDSNNLATVFAPNILHCIKPGNNKELSTERAEERIDVINVVRIMIDHNKELFQIPAELLDEVYIHMMDSHPDALDYLLRRRGYLGDELVDELEGTVAEGVCGETPSVPRTLTQTGSEHQLATTFSETEDQLRTVRRVWSREEFLHETAGMGGPDVSMRPRHKDRDRGRERSSKKRWKEEPSSRKKVEPDGEIDLPKTGFGIASSTSASQISLSSYQKSSFLPEQHLETAAKMRSASINDGDAVTTGDLLERGFYDEVNDDGCRRQSSPQLSDSGSGGGVITASLKIPVPSGTSGTSFALNLDDADIPYIEDGGGGFSITSNGGRQHMTIGLVHCAGAGEGTYSATRSRRHRSASGSDSSQASTSVHPPGSALTSYHQQQGCDSALGSSATFSSPPHNTTPSICSSDAGHFSSPPSWASSPPASPDSIGTTVNFIPEELTIGTQQHHSQTARFSIATSSKGISPQMPSLNQVIPQKTYKEVTPAILQTVTFTSTSELQQVQRSDTGNERQSDIQGSKLAIHKVHIKKGELPKSASTSAVVSSFKKSVDFESGPEQSDRKLTTSISSIGGAVMRSKTADIERMLRIKGTEAYKVKTTTQQTPVQDDKKKYSKRRYVDSKHQTRHIPDSEALLEDSSTGGAGVSDEDAAVIRQRKSLQQGPVWKRRELIASDPKGRESAL